MQIVLPAELNLAPSWTPGLEDWAADASASYTVNEFDFSVPRGEREERFAALQQSAPTLLLLPAPLASTLVADGQVAAIPKSSVADPALGWEEVAPPVRKALGFVGDRPTVLPVTCSPLVVYCRLDLLQASGRTRPETWEEYDALVSSIAEWAPGLSAIEPRGAGSLASLFLSRAAASATSPTQFSFELDVSTGDPLIATPPFVQTLEQMIALNPMLAPESATASFADCANAFRCGRAAIAIGTFNDSPVALCDPPMTSGSGFPFETLPLPGRRTVFDRDASEWKALDGNLLNQPILVGFSGLCVCVLDGATEIEQQAAWNLWARLSQLQSDGIIPALPGVSCRVSPTGDANSATAAGSGAPGAALGSQAALLNSPHLIAELPCSGREPMLAALNESLNRALQDGMNAQEALDSAAASWNRIIDETGRPQVLNSYRLRRGLSPIR
ncbi:MAG: hypothetical protein KF861_01610 [Planctomycetaceae bacterium]|nr:hypothetical protein [Planctomycetaceae bacterium]